MPRVAWCFCFSLLLGFFAANSSVAGGLWLYIAKAAAPSSARAAGLEDKALHRKVTTEGYALQ